MRGYEGAKNHIEGYNVTLETNKGMSNYAIITLEGKKNEKYDHCIKESSKCTTSSTKNSYIALLPSSNLHKYTTDETRVLSPTGVVSIDEKARRTGIAPNKSYYNTV